MLICTYIDIPIFTSLDILTYLYIYIYTFILTETSLGGAPSLLIAPRTARAAWLEDLPDRHRGGGPFVARRMFRWGKT